MKASLPAILFLISLNSFAQNVGINVPVPSEKLDVNGNINLSGTIKTNGVAGQNGQALMTGTGGALVWAYPVDFKNFITFSAVVAGSTNWTVPAGVTKIYVEVWGGGGGGTSIGGGGGGGYSAGLITVTPASNVSYKVGAGGTASSSEATDGGNSYVTYSGTFIQGNGGAGSKASTFSVAPGGGFNFPNGTAFIGQAGEQGGSNEFEYYQSGSTTFIERQSGGKGGNAANTQYTGGKGAYQIRLVGSTNIYTSYGSHAMIPGGGGGGGLTWGGNIRDGAQGLVIIRY